MSLEKIPLKTLGRKESPKEKIARNRSAFDELPAQARKPDWIRIRLPSGQGMEKMKARLRSGGLHTVCESASCPNIHECFHKGTATFMILGDICTRRCSFCDVSHGRPAPVDDSEAVTLAKTVSEMGLRYVVITSVDRDDLRDGGAEHFARCIHRTRQANPGIHIEILTPDFRGGKRMEKAIEVFSQTPPDIFNHNIETVKQLYRNVRPGADYQWSLTLLKSIGEALPNVPTKSGIMLGLGETREQIRECLADLREHGVSMVTIGQYLQPSRHHHPVVKYWHPDEFEELAKLGKTMGFSHVASGPMVRSSYHAEQMAENAGLVSGN